MSQQTGSGGPMLNLPYAYFYGGNMMPGGFQYGTPAIYPVSVIYCCLTQFEQNRSYIFVLNDWAKCSFEKAISI